MKIVYHASPPAEAGSSFDDKMAWLATNAEKRGRETIEGMRAKVSKVSGDATVELTEVYIEVVPVAVAFGFELPQPRLVIVTEVNG